MSDQALKAAWQYFRMGVGLALVFAFVYMMLSGSGDAEVISHLLMLLMGLMQIGTGIVNKKTNGVTPHEDA